MSAGNHHLSDRLVLALRMVVSALHHGRRPLQGAFIVQIRLRHRHPAVATLLIHIRTTTWLRGHRSRWPHRPLHLFLVFLFGVRTR